MQNNCSAASPHCSDVPLVSKQAWSWQDRSSQVTLPPAADDMGAHDSSHTTCTCRWMGGCQGLVSGVCSRTDPKRLGQH